MLPTHFIILANSFSFLEVSYTFLEWGGWDSTIFQDPSSDYISEKNLITFSKYN
jgi:hypothetical protein